MTALAHHTQAVYHTDESCPELPEGYHFASDHRIATEGRILCAHCRATTTAHFQERRRVIHPWDIKGSELTTNWPGVPARR